MLLCRGEGHIPDRDVQIAVGKSDDAVDGTVCQRIQEIAGVRIAFGVNALGVDQNLVV